MKKTYTTIYAHADNTTTIITDEGKNLTMNQMVILAETAMMNDRGILDVIISNGRKSVELTQSFNTITCMWEIRKL